MVLHPGLKWGSEVSSFRHLPVWWRQFGGMWNKEGRQSSKNLVGVTLKNCKESKILAYVQASKLACCLFLGAVKTQKTLGLEIKDLITDGAAASAYLCHLLLAHCPMGAR